MTSPVLYAPVFNHVKEKHLDGAVLPPEGGATVIVGAERSKETAVKTVVRNKKLLGMSSTFASAMVPAQISHADLITNTLRSSKSLLLPVDASARLIELLVLLDQHWSFSKLQSFPLCLISRSSRDLTQALRNQSEFLGSNFFKGGERGREGGGLFQYATLCFPRVQRMSNNPGFFPLRNLKMFQSLDTIHAAFPPAQPKLILAYPASLSFGFSRRLFVDQFASVPGNVVLLTGKGEPNSLSRWLWERWNDSQEPGNKWGEGGLGAEVALDEQRRVTVRGCLSCVPGKPH
jgi:cleavage and polyadenylation specificity factor subunit 2